MTSSTCAALSRARRFDPVLRLVAAAAAAAFAGCAAEKLPPAPPPPPEVTVLTLAEETVPLSTELLGRTTAYRVAEVRPRVGGIILERRFTEGTDVEAGQPLYQIDPRRYAADVGRADANVKRAQAELDNARYELRRLTNLKENQVIGDKEYQAALFAEHAADAAYDLAVSEQRLAALNFEWTTVVAPISGRIGYSAVTEGALVTAEQPAPLTTIQQFDPMYVDVTQSSAELLRLQREYEAGALSAPGGQRTVHLLLEDRTPYPLEGALQFRDITVNPTTGTYALRLVFPNPQRLLLPGMFVRAIVQEGAAEHAILVPQQGVSRNHKGQPVALLVDADNHVEQRLLTLNRPLGNRWLVSSGLVAGERLIIEGALNVRPGSAVKAVDFAGDKAQLAAGEPPARDPAPRMAGPERPAPTTAASALPE